MRVLLAHPLTQCALRTVAGIRAQPLGLAYLGAMAERGGHEVRIIDAPTLEIPDGELVADAIAWRPDVLGLGCSTMAYREALQIIREVKSRLPDVHMIMGGPHVSFTDEDTMAECAELEAVVRGEGEWTFAEWLRRVEEGGDLSDVRGLTYRQGGQVRRNPDRPFEPDLDAFGLPAFHLLPMDRYLFGRKKRFSDVFSSRGCPYQCVFCSSSHLFGGRWRAHSVEHVVSEMELLRDKYKVDSIEVIDDTFTVGLERVHRICDLLIARGFHTEWTASCRAGMLTLELARKLKAAGCQMLFFGFESASQEVLDSLAKGIRVEQARETMEIVRRAGLYSVGSFILGSPADTMESIRKTIRFARELSPTYVQFTFLTPYPGTPLYEQMKARGMIPPQDWSNFSMMNPTLEHPTIPRKKLVNSIYWAYISFYLRPRFIWQEFRSGGFYFAPRAVRGLLQFIRGDV